MDNNTYYRILDFIEAYGGNQYKMLKKCTPGHELEYMTKGSEAGKAAREAFTAIVNTIGTSFNLKAGKVTQWQNSGTFVSYFWSQLKREKYEDSKISLSLFAEKGQESIRFRASVELAVESAEDTDKESYRKILELSLKPGLTYISGGNNEAEFRIIDETDNNVVKAANYKKVQVSYIIDKKQVTDDEQTIAALSDGVNKLLGYYDYALSGTIIGGSGGGGTGVVPVTISPKDIIKRIQMYIKAAGFTYGDDLIENFYLSLKSKPFVILAGTSGTGKTRLVRLFAEAIGATSANGRYCQVAVRPDWSDSTDLFGHVDLNGNFVPGVILPFLKTATDDLKHPYILCLDEMNLARVEYYMSDFLSIIESRDLKGGKVISDLVMTNDKYGNDEVAAKKYGEIGFPQNLYIVGTVNMDETTFPFSRKVLDRANTIEFSYVDLGLQFIEPLDTVKPYEADNSFLMSEYLVMGRDCQKYFDVIGSICNHLESINKILRKANAHVGYRVRDEIVFYLINNMNAGLLTEDEAFDNSIMQKILPRIQGSSTSIKDMLCELFNLLSDQKIDTNAADTSTAEAMQKILDNGSIKYPKSTAKIKFMVQRFEEDGFTSYWV